VDGECLFLFSLQSKYQKHHSHKHTENRERIEERIEERGRGVKDWIGLKKAASSHKGRTRQEPAEKDLPFETKTKKQTSALMRQDKNETNSNNSNINKRTLQTSAQQQK